MYTSALHIHADTTLASVHSMTAEAERGGNRKPALIPRQGQSQRRKSSLLNPGSSVSMEGENSTREWQGRSLQRLKDIFLWNTLQRPTSLSIFLAKKKKNWKKNCSRKKCLLGTDETPSMTILSRHFNDELTPPEPAVLLTVTDALQDPQNYEYSAIVWTELNQRENL